MVLKEVLLEKVNRALVVHDIFPRQVLRGVHGDCVSCSFSTETIIDILYYNKIQPWYDVLQQKKIVNHILLYDLTLGRLPLRSTYY